MDGTNSVHPKIQSGISITQFRQDSVSMSDHNRKRAVCSLPLKRSSSNHDFDASIHSISSWNQDSFSGANQKNRNQKSSRENNRSPSFARISFPPFPSRVPSPRNLSCRSPGPPERCVWRVKRSPSPLKYEKEIKIWRERINSPIDSRRNSLTDPTCNRIDRLKSIEGNLEDVSDDFHLKEIDTNPVTRFVQFVSDSSLTKKTQANYDASILGVNDFQPVTDVVAIELSHSLYGNLDFVLTPLMENRIRPELDPVLSSVFDCVGDIVLSEPHELGTALFSFPFGELPNMNVQIRNAILDILAEIRTVGCPLEKSVAVCTPVPAEDFIAFEKEIKGHISDEADDQSKNSNEFPVVRAFLPSILRNRFLAEMR